MSSVPLRILFPTSLSPRCAQAARAITQLSARGPVAVTLIHVTRPGLPVRPAQQALSECVLDVSEGSTVERTLIVHEDAVQAIAGLCSRNRFDVVMVPASDKGRLARLFTSSFRTRLMRQTGIPLWTADACLAGAEFGQPARTIACFVDFDDAPWRTLQLGETLAARLGARLRVVCALAEIDEATIGSLASQAPFTQAQAVTRLRSLTGAAVLPDVDFVEGYGSRALHHTLRRQRADLLVVGPRQARRALAARGFARLVDRAPCPVVCVEPTPTPLRASGWSVPVTADDAAQ